MKFSLVLFTIAICLTLPHSSSARMTRFFPNMANNPPSLLPNNTVLDAFRKFGNCRLGEKVDGLAKLKKHLNLFGYIPNLYTNFTDDFDDEFESAVKTYQNYFNLNVTGELDGHTINHLVRPRCGNPDIVNGWTTMHSRKTVGHYSFLPAVWPKRDLTFAFFPGNEVPDEAKAVFVRAFRKWSTVITMNFTETMSYYSADIRIGFFAGKHSEHEDNAPFDGVGGILAHANPPPSGLLHLDSDEYWFTGDDITTSPVASATDLESVAVHEIGHVLGLGHSSLESSVMYPYYKADTKQTDLANDDVNGIQSLYGANPSYHSPTTSSTPSTQKRELQWVVGVVLAVGLVLRLF